MKLDKINQKIIKILSEDGRMPNNEIASKVGVSEGTIRNRIKKLLSEGFLKVKGLINPDKFFAKQLIYILIKLEISRDWKEIAQKVSELPEVRSVSMITGRFDLLVELFIEPYHLLHFLTEELTKIGNISSTESLVAIKNFKKWI